MENYESIMIQQCKEAIHFNGGVGVTVTPIYAERITVDGLHYFNRVKGIKLIYHDIEVASYDLDTKKLTYLNRHNNPAVMLLVVDILNNFVGYKKYHLNNKKTQAFLQFVENSSAELSEYELGEMFNCI